MSGGVFRAPNGQTFVVTPEGRLIPIQQPKKPSLADIAKNIAKDKIEEETIGAVSSALGGSEAVGAATAAGNALYGGNALATAAEAANAAYGGNAAIAAAEAANAAYGGNAGVAALQAGPMSGLGAAATGAGVLAFAPALYYSGLGKKVFGGKKAPRREFVAEEVANLNTFDQSIPGFENLSPEKKLEFVTKLRETETRIGLPGYAEKGPDGKLVTKELSKKLPAYLQDLHDVYKTKASGEQQDNAFRFGNKIPDDFSIDEALAMPTLSDSYRKKLTGIKDIYSQVKGSEEMKNAPKKTGLKSIQPGEVINLPSVGVPPGSLKDLAGMVQGLQGITPNVDPGRNPFVNQNIDPGFYDPTLQKKVGVKGLSDLAKMVALKNVKPN